MEDLSYLRVEYDSIVLDKEEFIKILSLASRVSRSNSSTIECSCLTFIPDWDNKTLTLAIANDLTYFRAKVELLGEKSNALRDIFSIKMDTLNRIKSFFRNKILIYKKDNEFYIRLIDGDLLLYTVIPNISRLTFTSSINQLIYESNIEDFCKILSIYNNISDEYSGKSVSFDTNKVNLYGTNFYAESKLKTPLMNLLITDIDLLIRLSQYYSSTIQIFSTDSRIPKLQIRVSNIEIEILNLVSNFNQSVVDKLSTFVREPTYYVDVDALKRIVNIALSLIDIDKDLRIKASDKGLVIILKSSKGDSEFNLVTQSDNESEVNEVTLSVNILSRILSSVSSEKIGIHLGKIYTTISFGETKVIILNK